MGEGEDERFDGCDGHCEVRVRGEEGAVGGDDVEVFFVVSRARSCDAWWIDGHCGLREEGEEVREEVGSRFEIGIKCYRIV